MNFNTSNVKVPPKSDPFANPTLARFQYIKCEGSATTSNTPTADTPRFQYIKCEGSAIKELKEYLKHLNFNTSNVKVAQKRLNQPL